jgi:hypothetical protein
MSRLVRRRIAAGLFMFALSGAPLWNVEAAPRQPSSGSQMQRSANAFVPGSGTEIEFVGDDFEDANWSYDHRHPKSSREQDEQVRYPMGRSANDRWHEGPERGQPDHIQIIALPEPGVPGSTHGLLLRTLHSYIPGRNVREVHQDDLIANCVARLNGGVPVSERPSCVARVYLPPAEQWERRSGPHFGYRASASTVTTTKSKGIFSISRESEVEPYWPGMWIHFRAAGTRGAEKDSAYIAVRSNRMGHDFPAKEITEFGWWTLGMSFTPDGMVHYYASPGADDLTEADYLTSQFPYGFKAQQFRTYFFDVCNRSDGKTWSTPFVIDDPKLFVMNPTRINSIVARKEQQAEQMAARRAAAAERAAVQAAKRTSSRPSRTR